MNFFSFFRLFLIRGCNFFHLSGFPCKLCPPGSYNNKIRAETCYCCPPGYSSTYMKTSCRACPANEYADQGNFPNCTLCRSCFTKDSCKLNRVLPWSFLITNFYCSTLKKSIDRFLVCDWDLTAYIPGWSCFRTQISFLFFSVIFYFQVAVFFFFFFFSVVRVAKQRIIKGGEAKETSFKSYCCVVLNCPPRT